MRDILKNQVLDEATKSDSKFWKDEVQQNHKKNGQLSGSSPNGVHYNLSSNGVVNGAATTDGVHPHLLFSSSSIATTNINEPTTGRYGLHLHDPLNEWHLDQQPQRSLYSLPEGVRPMKMGADPFLLSKEEIQKVTAGIRHDLIGTDHPVLNKAAAYFFDDGSSSGGKKVRPVMVMLLSKAMEMSQQENHLQSPSPSYPVLESQRRLAQISEMIHTASLYHDDVIDNSDTRRGKPTVHKVFGSKMAILAGDYLLARASIYLARLRDVQVVETMSTIIEHLVRGEVMQMKPPKHEDTESSTTTSGTKAQMEYYLRKNFYKTASLMANSCKSAAILGKYDDSIVSAAYRYGKHVGLAFQLADDILDFEGNASSLGKPALADLNSGVATAPVLFAAEKFPQLQALIQRKFKEPGDLDLAMEYVSQTDGIERTKLLAHVHAELAIDAVMELEKSAYRDALVHLAYKIVDRTR